MSFGTEPFTPEEIALLPPPPPLPPLITPEEYHARLDLLQKSMSVVLGPDSAQWLADFLDAVVEYRDSL